jgi:cbb3-type cytochrome oxidase subunit 3
MAQAIGVIGLGSSLAGGIMSAFGAEKSGQAQQAMYNYQAQVARINSQIDQQNAEYAINQGEQQAQQYGLQAAQQYGKIVAGQAASGFDVNSGSNVDVQRSQRTISAMDLTQIRSNAAKTAYDYNVRSTMDTNQATLDVMAGQNAKLAGDIQATSSILGSVSSVSSKWLQGSQMGMFPGGGLLAG